MKKQTKNTVFMVSIIVILVGALVALSILTKKQNTPDENFFIYNAVNYVDKVDGLDLENQPMIGDKDAPVTLVEFFDFSCPYCNVFSQQSLPKIKEELIDTGKAKLYFVNYSFINDSSFRAAVAGEFIYQNSPKDYYKYFEGIYDIQQSESVQNWANEESLVDVAKDLKIDVDYKKLQKAIANYKGLDDVYLDRAIGEAYGVQGTPALMVENQIVDTKNIDGIISAVKAIAKEKANDNE